METYILSVCGAVLVSAVAVILMPEGKIGKFLDGILKLFCMLVILLPIPGLLGTFLNNDGGAEGSAGEVSMDSDFIGYVFSMRAESEEEALCQKLNQEYGIGVQAQILWEYAEYAYNVTKVLVKIENFGIYGEEEHIFVIEQAKECAESMFPDAEVEVYE